MTILLLQMFLQNFGLAALSSEPSVETELMHMGGGAHTQRVICGNPSGESTLEMDSEVFPQGSTLKEGFPFSQEARAEGNGLTCVAVGGWNRVRTEKGKEGPGWM